MHETDVVVIGAGAAGVAAARRLVAAQVPTVVLEARSRVGGRAWTMRGAGIPLDLGCGWLHSADENEWAAVATEVGFTIDRTPPPWGIRRNTLAFPPAELADFRAASDRFFSRLHAFDASTHDRPASDFLEPGNRWNALINSLSTYISGAELEHVSVHDLNNYHDSGENWRVAEGYGALVEAFAAPLDVRLECLATAIHHAGKRLRIETPNGDLHARAAIIAVPTSLLARELPRFVPALPDKVAAAAKLPLGLDDKFFLHVERAEDLPVETRLFGALDRLTGSYQVRPFGRPVIECYFGGSLARALEADSPDAFANHAIDQIAAHLGADIRKRLKPLFGSAWGRDPYALGAYSYARPGDAGAREVLADTVEDRLFFAGEACSVNDYSTAHGAYRTGEAAAEAVLGAFEKLGAM